MRRVETHCGGEFRQQFRRGYCAVGGAPGAQHDHRGFAPGKGQRGMVETAEPRLQGRVQIALVVAAHGHQLPACGELFHLHRGVLEFRLAGDWIVGRQSQGVDAGAAHEAPAPVHRHIGLRRAQRV